MLGLLYSAVLLSAAHQKGYFPAMGGFEGAVGLRFADSKHLCVVKPQMTPPLLRKRTWKLTPKMFGTLLINQCS